MKLFKLDVVRFDKRRAREVLVHAENQTTAESLVAGHFTGWSVENTFEIPGSAHFVIAELDPD